MTSTPKEFLANPDKVQRLAALLDDPVMQEALAVIRCSLEPKIYPSDKQDGAIIKGVNCSGGFAALRALEALAVLPPPKPAPPNDEKEPPSWGEVTLEDPKNL